MTAVTDFRRGKDIPDAVNSTYTHGHGAWRSVTAWRMRRRCKAPAPLWAMVRISFLVTGGYLAFLLSPWGPDWMRRTPSLLWLNQIIPWWVMSLGFVAYTALLLAGRVRALLVACLLGAFFYLCEFCALLATGLPHHAANGWVLCAFALCVVFHMAAARLVMIATARKGAR